MNPYKLFFWHLLFFLLFICQTSVAQVPTGGLLSVCPKEDKCGFVNHAGKIIIKPVFLETNDFSEGLAGVKLKTVNGLKWGFVDEAGKIVIEPAFEQVWDFHQGLSRFYDGEKFGFVDKSGNVLKNHFDVAESFSEGLALVKKKDTSKGSQYDYPIGFINTKGEEVIKYLFDYAGSFSDGLAPACISKECGFIDQTGSWSIEPRFAQTERFSQGLAAVKLSNSANTNDWGYIDKTGQFIIQPQFRVAEPFSEGLAVVGAGTTKGYIDRNGKLVIPMKYWEAYKFSEGLASVLLESSGEYFKEYGYINIEGKRNSTETYSSASEFKNSVAWVQKYNFFAKLDIPLGALAVTTSSYIDKKEKSFWKEKSH